MEQSLDSDLDLPSDMTLRCPLSCLHWLVNLTIFFFIKKIANVHVVATQCSPYHKYTGILESLGYSDKTLISSQVLHNMLPIYLPSLPLCHLIPCLPVTNQLFVQMSSYLHLEFIFSSLFPQGKIYFKNFFKGQIQTLFSPGSLPNTWSMKLSTSSLPHRYILCATTLNFLSLARLWDFTGRVHAKYQEHRG